MNEIPDEHVLPCDFCVYHMRFRKGVKLEVVRQAAERWLRASMMSQPPMPQDFVDAINAAVREVNPDAGEMVRGSMTLGSDFDEWLGPEAFRKYGFGPLPPEAVAAFEAKFAEVRDELKAQLVASAIEVEKKRMAGTLESLDFKDSNRTKHQTY